MFHVHSNFSESLPDILSDPHVLFTRNVTLKVGRCARLFIDLSNKLNMVTPNTVTIGKCTYFLSIFELPTSAYFSLRQIVSINQVNSCKTATVYLLICAQKVLLLGKDLLNILKGMKALNYLHSRHFWLLKSSPIFGVIGGVSLLYKFYDQYGKYSLIKNKILSNSKGKLSKQKRKNMDVQLKISKLNLTSISLDIVGVTILSLTPYVAASIVVPAYILLTSSAITSCTRTVLEGKAKLKVKNNWTINHFALNS